MLDSVPFDQGDLHLVFPNVDENSTVQDTLGGISGKLEDLARSFGVNAGETSAGLEYHRVCDFPLAGVFGRVDISDVSFRADLYFERHGALEQRWGPPWTVYAGVDVYFFDGEERSFVTVEEKSIIVQSELDAVREFDAYVDWLVERASSHELDYWRIQADIIHL